MEHMTFVEPEVNGQIAKFVAYTPPTRMEGPDGEAITGSSETYVTYYKGIKVLEIKEGGYKANLGKNKVDPNNITTVRVSFDPESVGYSNPVAANIAPDDPGLDVLRQSFADDLEVNVAIESSRKFKNSDDELISPLTPIFHLMGAKAPGGKPDMSTAGSNTRKVIAAVNGQTTKDARSDASQWAEIAGNNTGKLPPEGFRVLSDPEDWTKYSVIVPTESVRNRQGSGEVDINAIIEGVASALEERLNVENRNYVKAPREDEIGEGAPFKILTTKDGVSLGHYISSKYRYNFEWAYTYLTETAQMDASEDQVWALVDTLMQIADVSQVEAYGGGVKPNRELASHTEAARWVQWAIAHHFPYSENVDNEWKRSVCNYVVDKLRNIGERVAHQVVGRQSYLPQKQGLHVSPASPRQNNAENNKQATSNQSSDKDESAQRQNNDNQGEQSIDPVRLEKAVDFLNANWNDLTKLRVGYKQARKEGMSEVRVNASAEGLTLDDNGSLTLQEAITEQGKYLGRKSSSAPTQETNTSEPSNKPVNDPTPDPVADNSDPNEPLDENEFANLLGASSTEDWASSLAKVKNAGDASSLWNSAQSSLNTEVEFDGETLSLSDAFGALSAKLEAAQEIAEEVQGASDIQELSALRGRGKKEGLLDYEVEDGVSDESQKLSDIILNKHEEIKSNK